MKVDPPNWRKITLKAPKVDGSYSDVELLRPVWWLDQQSAEVGRTVHIAVPECGINGDAKVLSIEPCPEVSDRDDVRIVTGKFVHSSAFTFDLSIEGLDEPIGTTGNHPFWNEDKQEFVRADTLKPGDRLKTLKGISQVVSILPRAGPEPVFNLEVAGSHVYHASISGILVHNGGPCRNGIPNDVVELIHKNLSDSGDAQLYLWKTDNLPHNFKSGPEVIETYKGKRSLFDLGDRWGTLTKKEQNLANKYFLDIIGNRGDKVHVNVYRNYIEQGNQLPFEIEYLMKEFGFEWINPSTLGIP